MHNKYENLIMIGRDLLHRDWAVSLWHTSHEGNNRADFLPKRGLNDNSSVILHEGPPGITFVILKNVMDIEFVLP